MNILNLRAWLGDACHFCGMIYGNQRLNIHPCAAALKPTCETKQMIKFIEVMNKADDTWCFVNQDSIAKVTCKVETKRTGGAFDVRSTVDPSIPKITPVEEVTKFIITLHTAGGDGEITFHTESEANMWASTWLRIDEIVLRSQTKDR